MSSREDLMKSLREATRDDLWLTSYALLRAMEELDLGCVIGVVERVLDQAEAPEPRPEGLTRLLEERWGGVVPR